MGKKKWDAPAIGTRFGEWEVMSAPFYKGASYHVKCRCRCYEIVDVDLSSLMRGVTKGCKHPMRIDPGSRFGKWTVVRELDRHDSVRQKGQNRFFLCRCVCGTLREVALHHFLYNTTNSGCQRCGNTRHGHVRNDKPSKEYRAWRGMIARCDYPKHVAYKNYGGRGITYDPRWKSFEEFFKDMGLAPNPTDTLDRINNDLGYFKANCRWAPPKVQANNHRGCRIVEYQGEQMTLQQCSEKSGIPRSALFYRLKIGLSGEELFAPLGPRHKKGGFLYNGEFVTLKEGSVRSGIPLGTLKSRLTRGCSDDHLFDPVTLDR